MDSTLIPPEGLTEGARALLTIVPIAMTVLLPIVTKLIDKWGFIDKIPTNYVTLFLAVGLTLLFKYLLAPDLSFGGVVALVGLMGFGGTLLARGVKAINGKPK